MEDAVVNDLLMQFQADLIGIPVIRPENIETTALGAAYLAGLATGFWGSVEEIREQWAMDRTFYQQDLRRKESGPEKGMGKGCIQKPRLAGSRRLN